MTYKLSPVDFIEKISAAGTIQATNTLTISAPRLFNVPGMTVIYLVDEGVHVKKGDTVCILDAPELIQNYENAVSRYETIKMDMNKLILDNEMNLSSLQSQLENMEIRVAMNSLDSVQKQYAPPVKQKLFALELEKANVEKTKLEKKYAAQKQIYEAERRRLNSRMTTTENEVKRIIDQISSLTIVAPQDGLVLYSVSPVMVWFSSRGMSSAGGKIGVNSNVFGNMGLLQMPDLKQMEVSVEVPETDYKRILAGQKVYVAVDALNNLKTTGQVKRKTLAGKTANQQASLKVYEVIISIDSLHSMLTPGLSAHCEIMVSEVKDTVVVPTLAIFEKDSVKIVYVAEGEKFLPMPVETGLSNSSASIITKGLTGNETISLMEPPGRMIQRSINLSERTVPTSDSLKLKTLNNTIQHE